jgi:hypothetical protein
VVGPSYDFVGKTANNSERNMENKTKKIQAVVRRSNINQSSSSHEHV